MYVCLFVGVGELMNVTHQQVTIVCLNLTLSMH